MKQFFKNNGIALVMAIVAIVAGFHTFRLHGPIWAILAGLLIVYNAYQFLATCWCPIWNKVKTMPVFAGMTKKQAEKKAKQRMCVALADAGEIVEDLDDLQPEVTAKPAFAAEYAALKCVAGALEAKLTGEVTSKSYIRRTTERTEAHLVAVEAEVANMKTEFATFKGKLATPLAP